jgi:hypothetical protein
LKGTIAQQLFAQKERREGGRERERKERKEGRKEERKKDVI